MYQEVTTGREETSVIFERWRLVSVIEKRVDADETAEAREIGGEEFAVSFYVAGLVRGFIDGHMGGRASPRAAREESVDEFQIRYIRKPDLARHYS